MAGGMTYLPKRDGWKHEKVMWRSNNRPSPVGCAYLVSYRDHEGYWWRAGLTASQEDARDLVKEISRTYEVRVERLVVEARWSRKANWRRTNARDNR